MNGKEKRILLDKISLPFLFPSLNRVDDKDRLWKNFQSVLSEAKCENIRQVDRIQEKTFEWYHLQCSSTFQKEITPYIHIFGNNVSPDIWIEHLTFTLEFLLDSSDDIIDFNF